MIEALTLRWRLPGETTTLADAAVVAPVGLVPWAQSAPWQTGTDYVATAPASLVAQEGATYVCLVPHTAGVFADDLTAGKWLVVAERGDAGPAAWAQPVAWTTATAFAATGLVSTATFDGSSYVCLVSHTSGVFADDLAAGKWLLFAGKGADGSTILDGAGAPSSGTGVDGDFYINTTAWTIYGPKAAGAWGGPTSLIGSGLDGSTVLNGSGAPDNGTGADGDFYINTAAWTIYGPKAGGAWGGATSLLGSAGADGSTVLNGSGAPANGTGADGDFYINTAAWTIYGPKAGGAWGGATSLLGGTGTDGSTVLNGSGAPDNGTGADGDFYINTAAWAIYGPKAAGAWGSGTSLLGAAGATGWSAVDALASGATLTPALGTALDFSMTLTSNVTIANPTGAESGMTFVIELVQGGTGSYQATFGTAWKFPGGIAPILSVAVGARDLLFGLVRADGTVFANLERNYA